MVESYFKPVFTFAIRRTDNTAEAEELAQEIMYQAVYTLSKQISIANIDAYFWSIAHNTYKRWLGTKRRNMVFREYGDGYEGGDSFGNIERLCFTRP